jgi:hypothetical protein
MLVSKTSALPLGDTPITQLTFFTAPHPEKMAGVPGFEPGNAGIKNQCLTAWRYPNSKLTFLQRSIWEDGWGTWIRTRECWYQKPVPYRLAIPHLLYARR